MNEGDGSTPLFRYVDDVIKYAGTPDHVPKEYYDEHWGFLNKQHAFANYDEIDIENLREEHRIQKIKYMTGKRRYELRELDDAGWSQTWIVSYALATLGRGGFLIKQYRTQETRFHYPVEDKKGKIPIFSRLRRSEKQAQMEQGVYSQ